MKRRRYLYLLFSLILIVSNFESLESYWYELSTSFSTQSDASINIGQWMWNQGGASSYVKKEDLSTVNNSHWLALINGEPLNKFDIVVMQGSLGNFYKYNVQEFPWICNPEGADNICRDPDTYDMSVSGYRPLDFDLKNLSPYYIGDIVIVDGIVYTPNYETHGRAGSPKYNFGEYSPWRTVRHLDEQNAIAGELVYTTVNNQIEVYRAESNNNDRSPIDSNNRNWTRLNIDFRVGNTYKYGDVTKYNGDFYIYMGNGKVRNSFDPCDWRYGNSTKNKKLDGC